VAIAGVLLLALAAGPASGQVIDRVLAVVDRQVILLSDVRAAIDLGLVTAPSDARVLDALVERALVLAEVARYAPPEPVAADIDERLAGIEARLGTAAFEAALRRSGLDRSRLRVLLRQDALIESYLAQRFSVTAMPTDEQVIAYYRQRAVEFGGTPGEAQPSEAALALARGRLTEERRARLVAEWVDDLRRRAQVTLRSVRP
jgi:hypothetical protein